MAENYNNSNVGQLSQALGKHRSTVHRLIKLGLPRNPDKTFSLPKVIDWLCAREREGMRDDVDQNSPALERFRMARAELAEIELEERRGHFMPLPEIERAWCERVAVVAAGLDNLAGRLPPLLSGKKPDEMREIIRRETNDLRRAYARAGKYCPTDANEVLPSDQESTIRFLPAAKSVGAIGSTAKASDHQSQTAQASGLKNPLGSNRPECRCCDEGERKPHSGQ